MNNPENSGISEEKPVMKEALEFCEAVQRAIGIAADFRRDPSGENWQRLEDAQQYIGELSPFRGHSNRFQLKISAGEGIDSHLSKYGHPFRDNPGPTIVDEVSAIRNDEVVFFIREDENYFVVFGHEMKIEPVFPEE